MWHSPAGDRTLEGAERRLFVSALVMQLDILRTTEHDEGNENMLADVLNQVDAKDRRHLFLLVAEALLGDSLPMPLRAWSEAIIWETFQIMEWAVESEIEGPDPSDVHQFFHRQALLDALKERFPEEKFQKVKSKDKARWFAQIQMLSEEVLWDEDFLMYETFADVEPGKAAIAKELADIDPDYLSDAPPFLDAKTRRRLDALHDKLRIESNAAWEHFGKTGRLA